VASHLIEDIRTRMTTSEAARPETPTAAAP
jgi:hypothetical protein